MRYSLTDVAQVVLGLFHQQFFAINFLLPVFDLLDCKVAGTSCLLLVLLINISILVACLYESYLVLFTF